MDELKAVQSGENLLASTKDPFHRFSESVVPDEPKITSTLVQQPVKPPAMHRKEHDAIPRQPKRLGEEFEFDVAVKSEEPDFFADMTPDLAIKKAVVVESKTPLVSSKFEATVDQVKITSLPNCSTIHLLCCFKSCANILGMQFGNKF